MVNELLVNLVNRTLGTGKRTARGNQAYTCPFCHHHKPKLEVNFTENKDGINKWACWTCGKKGKTIKSLFKQVQVDASYFQELGKLVKNVSTDDIGEIKQNILELPKEFQTFIDNKDIMARHALAYLKKRNISKQDILKDKIYNEERSQSIATLGSEIEKQEANRQFQKIKAEREIQEQKLQNSRIIVILFVVIFTVLFLLLITFYKNNKERKQTNLELKVANEDLKIAKEKAEEASNLKSQFISTISHELRTPLYGVIGTTEILEEEYKVLRESSYLKALKFSANYLLALVNDILKVYKIEENKVVLENVVFNLEDKLITIKDSLETIARKNNNQIEVKVDQQLPEFLYGDAIRLSQIIMNLLSNSLKFTKNGKVSVTANLRKKENNFYYITFQVIDNGIGIPKQYQEKVFEKFVQIERREEDYQGTGLGLTIVHKLVSLFNGTIQLESEEHVGTTFTVELPFQSGVDKTKDFITEYDVDLSDETEYRILVVEDNKINQVVTKKLLENHHFQCELVDDGYQAIELLQTETFDAILMDINMPKINGFETSKIIREKGFTLPIIAVTAFEKEEIMDKIKEAQINDVVVKPFEPAKLFYIIRSYINK